MAVPSCLEVILTLEDSFVLEGIVYTRHEYWNGQSGSYRFFEDKTYITTCKLCGYRSYARDSYDVKKAHFIHCSRAHGYVFPAMGWIFNVRDKELQRLIQKCQDYDLEFYGYTEHNSCIKQYQLRIDGTQYVGCAVHIGNEPEII